MPASSTELHVHLDHHIQRKGVRYVAPTNDPATQNFTDLGVTQVRCSASQSRTFACGSMGRADRWCAVFPRYARKNRTQENGTYHAAEG